MTVPVPPELFVPTSMVEDYRGRGPAVIQWVYPTRRAPPFPYPDLIVDHAVLPAGLRRRAEAAVRTFMTRSEVIALHAYLEQTHPVWASRCRIGALELPLRGEEAAALLVYVPDSEGRSLWTVSLPAIAGVAPPPIPAIGFVAQWPWPGLLPEDIPGLAAQRERLGLPPVPEPGSATRPE